MPKENLSTDVETKLNEWADALEVSPEELFKWYGSFRTEEGELHGSQLNSNQLDERALRRVRIRAKRDFGAAAFVTGTADAIILGISGLIDNNAKARDAALELYREDPKQALKDGAVDKKGTPIDNRKTFPSGKSNFRFGKPLEKNLIQIVVGLVSVEKEGKREAPTPFSFTLDRNQPGSKPPPLFHRVRFPYSGLAVDEENRKLNVTVPRGAQFEDLGAVPDPAAVVKKFAPDALVDLEELEEWCQTHSNREVMGVEGDVVRMDLVPNPASGNRRLQIDNGHDIKGYGTTIWVPESIDIDFAEESRVVVFGNARPGNPDSDFGPSINAMGIFARVEYKVPLPEGLKRFEEPVAAPPVEFGPDEGGGVVVEPQASPPVVHRGADNPRAASIVFATIARMQGEKGAGWLEITEHVRRALKKEQVEEAVNALLDAGRIYEAQLGVFKALEPPTKEDSAAYADAMFSKAR